MDRRRRPQSGFGPQAPPHLRASVLSPETALPDPRRRPEPRRSLGRSIRRSRLRSPPPYAAGRTPRPRLLPPSKLFRGIRQYLQFQPPERSADLLYPATPPPPPTSRRRSPDRSFRVRPLPGIQPVTPADVYLHAVINRHRADDDPRPHQLRRQ